MKQKILIITLFLSFLFLLVYSFIEVHKYIYTFTPFPIQPLVILAPALTILGLLLLTSKRTLLTRKIVQFSFIWSVPPYILALLLYLTTIIPVPTSYAPALTILLSTYMYTKARDHKHRQVKILSKKDSDLRIAHITDIHLGDIWGRKELQRIVDDVNEQEPDITVITGDVSDGMEEVDADQYTPLSHLEMPSYFVTGNHDTYTSQKAVLRKLEQNKVTILNNEVVHLSKLTLAGISYGDTEKQLLNHKEPIPSHKPFILLQHEPKNIDVLKPDLVLSGHVHDGQIWPLKYFAKIQFQYINGLYKEEDKNVYVSSGTKTWGPPYRLGTKSELTTFSFIPSKKE